MIPSTACAASTTSVPPNSSPPAGEENKPGASGFIWEITEFPVLDKVTSLSSEQLSDVFYHHLRTRKITLAEAIPGLFGTDTSRQTSAASPAAKGEPVPSKDNLKRLKALYTGMFDHCQEQSAEMHCRLLKTQLICRQLRDQSSSLPSAGKVTNKQFVERMKALVQMAKADAQEYINCEKAFFTRFLSIGFTKELLQSAITSRERELIGREMVRRFEQLLQSAEDDAANNPDGFIQGNDMGLDEALRTMYSQEQQLIASDASMNFALAELTALQYTERLYEIVEKSDLSSLITGNSHQHDCPASAQATGRPESR